MCELRIEKQRSTSAHTGLLYVSDVALGGKWEATFLRVVVLEQSLDWKQKSRTLSQLQAWRSGCMGILASRPATDESSPPVMVRPVVESTGRHEREKRE